MEDRGRLARERREAHAAWLRSATMEDRGTPATGERLTLHGGGLPRWRIAVPLERERGSHCMSSLGHDAGSRYLGNGREPHAAWLRSATMEDRGTPGTGERLTLHGGGRPRWLRIIIIAEPRTGERRTLHGCSRPRPQRFTLCLANPPPPIPGRAAVIHHGKFPGSQARVPG